MPEDVKKTIQTKQTRAPSSVGEPASAKVYLTIALVGLLITALAVYYYLQYIQGQVSAGVDQRIFYLILIIFGIAVSAVVFGFMQSYATLKGEKFNTQYKLTGPIVGVALTVLGGFYLPKTETADRIVTIRVFDKNGSPLNGGDVKIYLPEYIRTQSIDKMGQAQFTGVPINSLKEKIKVEVASPGYTAQQFDTVLGKNGTLELVLPLQSIVFISGQVKQANETPIADVEINVDGTRYVAYSISNGTYRLRLEEYTLGDEITLTTSHMNFEDKTRSIRIHAPEIKDIDFILQPIQTGE